MGDEERGFNLTHRRLPVTFISGRCVTRENVMTTGMSLEKTLQPRAKLPMKKHPTAHGKKRTPRNNAFILTASI